MPENIKTPGVYIQEINAFPNSIISVGTAIPVFIGYTGKAVCNGKSLKGKPTRISSFNEYVEQFGGSFRAKFSLREADPAIKQDVLDINGKKVTVQIRDNQSFYLYNSIRLFYANGGETCYILAVDTYDDKEDGLQICLDDFVGSATKADPFEQLKKETEPSLILVPDATVLGEECYKVVYNKILLHCESTQSCFGILDLLKQQSAESTADVADTFRNNIGMAGASYGAAYYPWLKTTVVQAREVTFENLDQSVELESVLPPTELAAIQLVRDFRKIATPTDVDKTNFHQALITSSATYKHMLDAIQVYLNELPPSGAIAGIYATIDQSNGVWRAPANISLHMVQGVSVNTSTEQTEYLVNDLSQGKSINVIRTFPGTGTLVWGARTLDANSQDWRYINVRRTTIMIEQSLRQGLKSYIFEPNVGTTWLEVKSKVTSYLTNLWMQGALAGSQPEQAFNVHIGLGETMTPDDVLQGIMRLTVLVAVVRPEDFIEIAFEQQMPQS